MVGWPSGDVAAPPAVDVPVVRPADEVDEELVAPVELVPALFDVCELPMLAPPLVAPAVLLPDVLLVLVAWLPPAENVTWPVTSNWLCGGGGTLPEPTPDDIAVVADETLPAED
jgi:hypothetical protein